MQRKRTDFFLLSRISETFGVDYENVSNIELTQYRLYSDVEREALKKLYPNGLELMEDKQFINSEIDHKKFWLIVDSANNGKDERYQQIILPLFAQNYNGENETIKIVASRNTEIAPSICSYIKINKDGNLEFDSKSFIDLLYGFIKKVDDLYHKSSPILMCHRDIPYRHNDDHEFIFETNMLTYNNEINETLLIIIKNIRF